MGWLDWGQPQDGTQPDQNQGLGLMGMYTNPQQAGLLGAASALLGASGASRLPVTMGAALGQGLQGMQQGAQQGIALNRQMQQYKLLNDFMTGNGSGPAPMQPPTKPLPYSAVSGPADTGALTGVGAGMGGAGPTQADADNANAQAQQQFDQQQTQYQAQGPTIFGMTPRQMYQRGMIMNLLGIQGGGDLINLAAKYDPTLAYAMPTDNQRDAAAAYGYGTPQAQAALQGIVTKNGSMTGRAGGYVIGPQGVTWLPNVEQGGMPVIQNGVPTGAVTPQPGATTVASSMAAAKAGGKAQYSLQQVWDPAANNGAGGFVQQTVANVADAANGGAQSGAVPAANVPIGIRNNNFGNIRGSGNGGFAQYDTPQDGVNAADQLLSTYGGKSGFNTIAGIANKWAPAGDGNNNPTAKAATIAAASGVAVNQPINLRDPAVRARILPALFDTETPGWRNALGGGASVAPQAAPARGGPMAAQPPQGSTSAANAAQGAPSKQMADSYATLSGADANYQGSRQALMEMLSITHNGGWGDAAVRMLPEGMATRISNDAAEYEKAHANYVSLQGKALGAGGTDASRATTDEAVPTFDKPQDAKINGLTNQLNTLDLNHLKTQFMNPAYAAGNEKAYTALNAQFDKTIQPEMMPVLNTLMGLQSKQQLAAGIATLNKRYPQYKKAIDFLGANGMFNGVQ